MSAPFLWRKLFGDDTSATKLLSGLLSWSDKTPLAPGSASAGKAEAAAREDHVHPLPGKLLTARTIDGISFDGGGDLSRYALCSTAGATVAKTVTVSNFLLKVGAVVVVKFANTNTAASPTLNVSGTGAKGIFFGGAAIGAGAVIAGRTYTLVYDGVGWELVGDLYAQQVSDLIAELDFLRKLKIGAPRYHCSTTLPDRHAWINGDFIAFEDAPEFGEKYEAGGFDGMVMPWDADEEHQAAHLGQFRPDSANPTGLFLPVDGGQFFRNWAPGDSLVAGAHNEAGLPEISGKVSRAFLTLNAKTEGAFNLNDKNVGSQSGGESAISELIFSASKSNTIYGNSATVMPASVNHPVCLYLGRPA